MAKKEKVKLTDEQYRALEVVSPEFTMSFPHLFQKGTYQGKETNYNFTMKFPKETDLTGIREALNKAKTFNWGKDAKAWPKSYRKAITDGDTSDNEADHGYWLVSATSIEPRQVVDRNKNEIVNPNDVYGGCVCRAVLQAATYSLSKDNQGEKFYFKVVQKMADGKRLGKGGAALDMLDDLNEGADDPDSYEDSSDSEDHDTSMW